MGWIGKVEERGSGQGGLEIQIFKWGILGRLLPKCGGGFQIKLLYTSNHQIRH